VHVQRGRVLDAAPAGQRPQGDDRAGAGEDRDIAGATIHGIPGIAAIVLPAEEVVPVSGGQPDDLAAQLRIGIGRGGEGGRDQRRAKGVLLRAVVGLFLFRVEVV